MVKITFSCKRDHRVLCTTLPELSAAPFSLLPLQTSSGNDDTPVTFVDISILSTEIGTSERRSRNIVARCVYFTLPFLRLSRASPSLRPPSPLNKAESALRPRLFQQWAESLGLRMFATQSCPLQRLRTITSTALLLSLKNYSTSSLKVR